MSFLRPLLSVFALRARTLAVVCTAVITVVSTSAGAEPPLHFDDAQRQARYEGLLQELRCLVCQNESLASSDAGLAVDLRQQVYRMLAEGSSDAQIKSYLVQRYGEFVLYRPPLDAKTVLLWFGPFLLLVLGAIWLWRALANRRPTASNYPREIDPDDAADLQRLLDKYSDENV